jgi:hypothetical protein
MGWHAGSINKKMQTITGQKNSAKKRKITGALCRTQGSF